MDRKGGLLLSCFWIASLDQFQKGLPWNYLLPIGQELLALSPLFGRGLLVVEEIQMLAALYPVLASDHTVSIAQSGLIFQSLLGSLQLDFHWRPVFWQP